MNACLSPKKAKQLTVLVHLCQLSISDIVLPGKNEARTSFHNVLASSVLSCCSENSTVRGNDCQNPPPENKLIPRLIIVTLIQMCRLTIHASCQFSDYLKPDPFGLCSDSHIHFLLIPLTVTIRFLDLVYIIALHVSQKFPFVRSEQKN